MLITEPILTTNRLLAALPDRDRKRFLTASETVKLEFAEVLIEPGERIRHVYFPTQGFISLMTRTEGRECLEVGLVGDEGMLGASLVLGVDLAPLRSVVQGEGVALRMDITPFRRQLEQSSALTLQLKRYLYVTMGQIAQSAVCARFHLLEARLARWLLMTQDRAHSNDFRLTHEFLAYMLGMRRVGITKAATALQNSKLIHYKRGAITVLDREGLEAAACVCYATDNASYQELMKP